MKYKKRTCLALIGLSAWGAASAEEFEIGGISGTIKSALSFGAGIRTERPDDRNLAKLHVPGQQNLCQADDCSSTMGDPAPARRFVAAAGTYYGSNKDQGDLNYHQWGLVSAYTKLNEAVTLSYGNFTLRAAALGFFDAQQYSFSDRHVDTHLQPPLTPRDPKIRNELGRDWQLRDLFVTGRFQLLDHDFNASLGYQHVRWGESSYIALNSLSEINPPDAHLLHQPGTPINEVFRPTPLFLLNTQLDEGLALDLLYQLSWVPVVPDPYGAFFSNLNIVNGAYAMISLGQFSQDPTCQHRISTLSQSCARSNVLSPNFGYPRSQGQFGGKLSWYLPELNGGTELGFYYLHYHSRLPYVSETAASESCLHNSATAAQAVIDCNGFNGINTASGKEPLPVDTIQTFLDYPENIHLLGISFNTNFGAWSLAGEYSFRPNLPVQVDVSDLTFVALQPVFPRQDLVIVPGLPGLPALPANVPEIIIPSGRHTAPDYLEGYEHFSVQPKQILHGYIRLPVDQLQFTGIRAIGASENPVGADQILILSEIGFTHVWNFPARRNLQLEAGDNNDTHASPGIIQTGDASLQNYTQQTHGFASSFAWGYRVMVRFEYNNLLFGWNFKPNLLWSQDVSGNGIQPAQNFIAGAKQYIVGTDIEFTNQWNGQIFYQGFTGGGTVNTQRDRDFIGAAVSYSF